MIEPEVAMDKLGALGSPQDIAKFLLEEGVRGRQMQAMSCPVANYVRRESGKTISISSHGWGCRGGSPRHSTPPKSVTAFIALFDAGAFPSLMEGNY